MFVADMSRIFANCRTYNGPDTEYYRCAGVVERFFISKLHELYDGKGIKKESWCKEKVNIIYLTSWQPLNMTVKGAMEYGMQLCWCLQA